MSYQVRLSPAAARQYRKLPTKVQARLRKALHALGKRPAGTRGGKSLKLIQGKGDQFFRLRVGNYRVMFDKLEEEQVILVLAIVNRADLESWLRGR